MCPAHRAEADGVSAERFERARASNSEGWTAVLDACRRLELPHLPDGLATRMAGAAERMYELREPNELAAMTQDLVEAARWFTGRDEDLAIALGAEEDMPWLPEWMENLVLDLGRARLASEAIEAADATDPDRSGQRVDLRRRPGLRLGRSGRRLGGPGPHRRQSGSMARRALGPGSRWRRPSRAGRLRRSRGPLPRRLGDGRGGRRLRVALRCLRPVGRVGPGCWPDHHHPTGQPC